MVQFFVSHQIITGEAGVNDTAATDTTGMTAQQIAERVAEVMFAQDNASKKLDMEVLGVGPGTASTTMVIDESMVNGHGVCHGGYIFTLADSAMAFASNSYNINALAMECSINFLAPGKLGSRLTASAREIWKSGKNALFDISVTSDDGETIAHFRGKTRQVRGTIF